LINSIQDIRNTSKTEKNNSVFLKIFGKASHCEAFFVFSCHIFCIFFVFYCLAWLLQNNVMLLMLADFGQYVRRDLRELKGIEK